MAYPPESIIAISIVLPLLALVAVCLRFYVRIRVRPAYIGIDDWLAVFSVLLTLANGAILILGVVRGTQGRVYEEIPHDRYIIQARVDFTTLIIEKPLYGGMKLCMLFFFRRIFSANRKFRIFSDVVIGLITAWTFAYIIAYLFSCAPLGIWFTPGAPRTPPNCVDVNLLNFTYAITDPISDILVVIMPFPLIRRLQITRRERVGLVAIFLLASLSTVAALVRLGFIAQGYVNGFGNGGNNRGSGIAPAVWSMIEGAVGVLAANLPPLGPLIRKPHVPRRLSAVSASIKEVLRSASTAKTESVNPSPEMACREWNRNDIGVAVPMRPSTADVEAGHHGPKDKASNESFV